MRRACEASVTIDASIEDVWRVVVDVTRVGEWSGECVASGWVDGVAEAAPGARFQGGNRRGRMRWTRLNEFDVVDPPHELVWHTVFTPMYRDSTEWRLRLRATEDGTELTESFRVLRLSHTMEAVFAVVQPGHRDRSDDLAGDLDRLKTLVESGVA